MPLFVQPALRARQTLMETEGLIQTRDSTLVTIQKAKETQGLTAKPSIPGTFEVIRGNKYNHQNQF